MLRRLESLWTHIWTRALTRGGSGGDARSRQLPDWRSRRFRVLFLRYDKIGDMINLTGLVRALARQHPHFEIDVLASPANAAILRGNPHVGNVIVFNLGAGFTYPRSLARVRRGRYDIVIDPMVTRARRASLLLMGASGAPYRIGFHARKWGSAVTLPAIDANPDATYVERSAATLSPFGVDPAGTDLRPELHLTAAERARANSVWPSGEGTRLLVNISASVARKRWLDERFVAAVAGGASRCGRLRVVVISAPEERPSADSIAADLAARDIAAVSVHTPAIHDALALVESAELVLTPDTSISHAASAFQVPAVVLIAPQALTYRPYAIDVRLVKSTSSTFADIGVAEVIEALCALLPGDDPARD